jgi:opacity protein-like surface antigen
MTKIWKLAVACAFTVTAVPALAADLPAPAPVYKAAPVVAPSYSWTGFYLGLNAGYSWGDRDMQFFNGDPAFYALALAGGEIPATLAPNPQGFVGGGQAGYNMQSGFVVYGIETDIQYANVKGTAVAATSILPFPNISTAAQEKLDWLGTLRGRLGVSNSDFLLYATGGLAYGSRLGIVEHRGDRSARQFMRQQSLLQRRRGQHHQSRLDRGAGRGICLRPTVDREARISLLRSRQRDL